MLAMLGRTFQGESHDDRSLSPQDVRAMLRDGAELALLDVREEGVFSEEGHPFFANSLPLSRLELMRARAGAAPVDADRRL